MRFLIEELNGLRKTVTSFETADLDHMTALYHGMMKKETVRGITVDYSGSDAGIER